MPLKPNARTFVEGRAPNARAKTPPARTSAPSAHIDLGYSGTKSVILKAALELFARTSFERTTLPEIARAAKVGHPLILYHFGSKENLWRIAVANSLAGIVEEAAAVTIACRDMPVMERLKALIRVFTLFVARHPNHLAILISELRNRTERSAWLTEHFTDPFITQLRSVLSEAQVTGQIKNIPMDTVIGILTGAISNNFSFNTQAPLADSIESAAAAHADHVIDVLFDGLRVRDPRQRQPA